MIAGLSPNHSSFRFAEHEANADLKPASFTKVFSGVNSDSGCGVSQLSLQLVLTARIKAAAMVIFLFLNIFFILESI
jgi:hypothetical protein